MLLTFKVLKITRSGIITEKYIYKKIPILDSVEVKNKPRPNTQAPKIDIRGMLCERTNFMVSRLYLIFHNLIGIDL